MGLSVGDARAVLAGGDVGLQARAQVAVALVIEEGLQVGAGLGAGAALKNGIL